MAELPRSWSASKPNWAPGCRFEKQPVYLISSCRPGRPHNHRTVSNRQGKVADQIEKWDLAGPYRISRAGKPPVSVFIDGVYIRAVTGYQSRHFEIAMGRVVAQGRAPRQFAVRRTSLPARRRCARNDGLPGRDVTVFSDGEFGLQSIVLSATRQPVTHILDWFHPSMRLRHIEQAWEGIRHLQSVAVHVLRLRHLLWSGYVREASVKQMLAQLGQQPGCRDAPGKIRRIYELINNLGT